MARVREADPLAGSLRIGRDGQIELDRKTVERLAGRDFGVLIGPGDLLLAIGCDGGASPASTPMLAGDLGYVSFAEVVSLIAQARGSGVLRVSGASGTRRVIFAEGEVCGAHSERVGERLDEILVRMGLLKTEQVESLSRETSGGRRVGRLAVERGLLSERELWNAIQEHVIAIFQAILLENRGGFLLSDEKLADAATVPGLSAEGLLMEGARRLDELRVPGGEGSVERVAAAFAGAFRDIFATADHAGAGDALRAAAASVFDDDPDPEHAGVFQGLGLSPAGDLPEAELVRRAVEAGARDGRRPEAILQASLKTVMLFLLYVAGEHLEPATQQALNARVKSLVSGD